MTTSKKPYVAPQVTDLVPSKALDVYVSALESQQEAVKGALDEANASWEIVKDFKIQNDEQYKIIGTFVKEAKDKAKFFDQERKVSVTPLNNEVDRINAWYKPALDALKAVAVHGERLMSNFTLEQRRKEQALLAKAKEEAQKVLSTNADVTGATAIATSQLVQEAAATAPPKLTKAIDGVAATAKPIWRFVIKNPLLLITKHPELAMVDEKKVKAWVAEHGDKDVPAGVEVIEDVKTSVR